MPTPLDWFEWASPFYTEGFTPPRAYGAVHVSGRWFLCGMGVYKLYRSDDDGDTWQPVDLNWSVGETLSLFNIIHADGKVVAAGSNGAIFVSEDDGDTWTRNPNPGTGATISSLNYARGNWIINAGGSDAAYIKYSQDPLGVFIDASMMQNLSPRMFVTADDTVIAGASLARIIVSPDDGQSWGESVRAWDDMMRSPNAGAYQGGRTLVAGGNGYFAWSDDGGHTWSEGQHDTIASVDGVAAGDGQWITMTGTGIVRWSPDAENFETAPNVPGSGTCWMAAHVNGLWLVSRAGTVYASEAGSPPISASIAADVSLGPSATASTSPQATVSAFVAILAGMPRCAEINATVPFSAAARARFGPPNLLEGLHAYFPFFPIISGAPPVSRCPHSSIEALLEGTRCADHRWVSAGAESHSVCAAWYPALINQCAVFDNYEESTEGTPSKQVRVRGFKNPGEDDFTISVWQHRLIPPESWRGQYGLGWHAPIVHTRHNAPTLSMNRLDLRVHDYGGTPASFRVRLRLRGDSTTTDVSGSASPPDQEWVHYLIVRRDDRIRVYVNLVLDIDIEAPPGSLGIDGGDWGFGRYQAQNEPNATMWGFMDEIGVWDRALEMDEAEIIYNNGLGLTYPFVTTGWAEARIPIGLWSRMIGDYRDVSPPETRRFYVAELTGDADGLDDVELPISSWQATRRRGESASYLQVVVPAADDYMTAIAERPNGTLVVKSKTMITGRPLFVEKILSTPMSEPPSYQRGPRRRSVVLSGYGPDPITGEGIHPLRGVRSYSMQAGKRRVRADVDFWVRPGATVEAQGEAFVVEWVNHYTGSGQSFMDVGEGDG